MKNKIIRGICFAGIIVCILFITLFIFKKDIVNVYFSIKYENELNTVKNYLNVITKNDIQTLNKICDSECSVFRPENLSNYQMVLRKINMNSLKVDYADLKNHDDADRFFTIVYFENDKTAFINITLKKQDSKWIMMIFGMSEKFKNFL